MAGEQWRGQGARPLRDPVLCGLVRLSRAGRPCATGAGHGAIGRLDRQKGFDTLIEAFRQTRNPNVALHIYGEGEEGLALRALAEGDPRI